MRCLFIILLVLVSYSIKAQVELEQRTFIALIVSNRDSSINWYREYLHLKLTDSTSIPERGLKMANLIGPEFHIELIEFKESLSLKEEIQPVQGIFKVGRGIEKLDELHDHLKIKKAHFRSEMFYDQKTKLRSFIILDPNGNRIQFFGK